MKRSTIKKAAEFFYPFLNKEFEVYISFYGGEPMLAFDNIAYTVDVFNELNKQENKNLLFNFTTNGSLITDEHLDYFNRHRFDIMLSYDGTAQEAGRKSGSFNPTETLFRRFQSYPDIKFSTYSVFSPGTVSLLSESLQYIVENGGKEVKMTQAITESWDDKAIQTLGHQLESLTEFLVRYYKETETIPVPDFRPPEKDAGKGFYCAGSKDRLSISPDEDVWGCYLFHDYLKDRKEDDDYALYSFGKLDDFMENHEARYPQIRENYRELRQNRFIVGKEFCFLCEEVDNCAECPVNAAYATNSIGKLPPWICRLNKIKRKHKETFLAAIGKT
jgi:sulfatase maturation enzyme AslB (radical SAM superfamily)